MDWTIIDYALRPEREPMYARLARAGACEVLVAGRSAPASSAFAWEHVGPGWRGRAALARNLRLSPARRWTAVEPGVADLVWIERLARRCGVTLEVWLDERQGASWGAYLLRRALGATWEAVPWPTGIRVAERGGAA